MVCNHPAQVDLDGSTMDIVCNYSDPNGLNFVGQAGILLKLKWRPDNPNLEYAGMSKCLFMLHRAIDMDNVVTRNLEGNPPMKPAIPLVPNNSEAINGATLENFNEVGFLSWININNGYPAYLKETQSTHKLREIERTSYYLVSFYCRRCNPNQPIANPLWLAYGAQIVPNSGFSVTRHYIRYTTGQISLAMQVKPARFTTSILVNDPINVNPGGINVISPTTLIQNRIVSGAIAIYPDKPIIRSDEMNGSIMDLRWDIGIQTYPDSPLDYDQTRLNVVTNTIIPTGVMDEFTTWIDAPRNSFELNLQKGLSRITLSSILYGYRYTIIDMNLGEKQGLVFAPANILESIQCSRDYNIPPSAPPPSKRSINVESLQSQDQPKIHVAEQAIVISAVTPMHGVLDIHDLTGRKLVSEDIQGTYASIPFSQQGVFILTFTQGAEVMVQKIVK
jgi:hypothetical protein